MAFRHLLMHLKFEPKDSFRKLCWQKQRSHLSLQSPQATTVQSSSEPKWPRSTQCAIIPKRLSSSSLVSRGLSPAGDAALQSQPCRISFTDKQPTAYGPDDPLKRPKFTSQRKAAGPSKYACAEKQGWAFGREIHLKEPWPSTVDQQAPTTLLVTHRLHREKKATKNRSKAAMSVGLLRHAAHSGPQRQY